MNKFCLLSIFLCLSTYEANGQPGAVQLPIDIEKGVNYFQDVTDYSRFATDAGPQAVAASRNFSSGVRIIDIVAVNGEPARGTAFGQQYTLIAGPNPAPGQAIADVSAGGGVDWVCVIQSSIVRLLDARLRPIS